MRRYKNPLKRKVLQLDKDTGEVLRSFGSLKEAAAEVGVGYINISRVCHGKIGHQRDIDGNLQMRVFISLTKHP